jgi:hypothetical protein
MNVGPIAKRACRLPAAASDCRLGLRWLAGAALVGLMLAAQRLGAVAPAQAAVAVTPTATAAPTPTLPAWASTLPLTTTTVSIYLNNQCAEWGVRAGTTATVTVPAGPVLLSYSMFSRYTQTPRHEYKVIFSKRVGSTLADLALNGQPLTDTYRGELRIEHVPAPVSKRYSYATYGLAVLKPGVYEISGRWMLASGEKDGPRKCWLVVTP